MLHFYYVLSIIQIEQDKKAKDNLFISEIMTSFVKNVIYVYQHVSQRCKQEENKLENHRKHLI